MMCSAPLQYFRGSGRLVQNQRKAVVSDLSIRKLQQKYYRKNRLKILTVPIVVEL